MADALDSKSSGRKAVWVQVPPPVLIAPQVVASPVAGPPLLATRALPLSARANFVPQGSLNTARSRIVEILRTRPPERHEQLFSQIGGMTAWNARHRTT